MADPFFRSRDRSGGLLELLESPHSALRKWPSGFSQNQPLDQREGEALAHGVYNSIPNLMDAAQSLGEYTMGGQRFPQSSRGLRKKWEVDLLNEEFVPSTEWQKVISYLGESTVDPGLLAYPWYAARVVARLAKNNPVAHALLLKKFPHLRMNMADDTKRLSRNGEAVNRISVADPEEGFKRLYNASTADYDPAGYLEPHVSDWVKEVAGGASDEIPIEEMTRELVYLSDDPIGWQKMIVGRKIGKQADKVTMSDIRQHGRLNIVDADIEADELFNVGDYGSDNSLTDLAGNRRRFYDTSIYDYDDFREMPVGPESSDWISKEAQEVKYSLTGDDLVDFLKRNGLDDTPVSRNGEAVGGSNALPYVGTEYEGKRLLNYKNKTEQVSVDDLIDLRGNDIGSTHHYDNLEELKADIVKEGGLREPVTITVGKNDRMATVGEGNHRVIAAKELGYDYVPTRVVVQQEAGSGFKHPRNDLIPEPNAYFSADAKPSEVFTDLRIQRESAPVTRNGEAVKPETWYHGSRDGIDVRSGEPLWLTDSLPEAERYARGGTVYRVTPNVKPVEVSSVDMINGQFGDNIAITREMKTAPLGNRSSESSRWLGLKNSDTLEPSQITPVTRNGEAVNNLPIRPAKENLQTVIQSNTVGGKVVGDEMVPIESLSGGASVSSRGQGAIDEIAKQMTGPDGYIERLIVDQDGNVIEGAHRLDALRKIGINDVPVTRISDPTAHIDVAAMEKAIRDVGPTHSDHVNRIVADIGEMLDDVGGDPAKVLDKYEFPAGFEAKYRAALNRVARNGESVLPMVAPTPPFKRNTPPLQQAVDFYKLHGIDVPVNQLTSAQKSELTRYGKALANPSVRRRESMILGDQQTGLKINMPNDRQVIQPSDVQDSVLVPVVGDQSVTGGTLSNIGGVPLSRDVPVQGGAHYPLERKGTGYGWASMEGAARNKQNNIINAAESTGRNPIGVYSAMGDDSINFSTPVAESMIAQLNAIGIPKKDMVALNSAIRNMKVRNPNTGKIEKPFSHFVGVDSPDVYQQILGQGDFPMEAAGKLRKGIVAEMSKAKWRNKGFPVYGDVQQAINDPRLSGVNVGDSGFSMFTANPSSGLLDSPNHLTYNKGIPGEYRGGFESPVPPEIMFPDVFDALSKKVNSAGVPFPREQQVGSLRSAQLQQIADQEWVDRVSRYLETHRVPYDKQ